jgi:plastocyanin
MRRYVIPGVLAALAALSVLVATMTSGAATTPTKAVSIAETHCPRNAQFCFLPATLTVTKGTKVVWKNATFTQHTVTRCTKSACGVSGGTGTDPKLASPLINATKTYAFTFQHAGTYVYFCTVHGFVAMHGLVTVK